MTSLRKESPFPQFNVASHKRPEIRLSFEYTTTLLSGEGGQGRTGTATMFRKMLSKCTIFSTVLSKIVGSLNCQSFQCLCEVWKTKFSKKTNGLALGQKKMKNVKRKKIVYYKLEMVLRNWEMTHD